METSPRWEWKIVRVGANPVCHGPVEFRLQAVCPGCGAAVGFSSKATLLASAEMPCPGCKQANVYRFRPEMHEPLAARLKACRAAEEAVYERAWTSEGAARRLGNNLYFPIFAWLSNGLR